MSQVNQPKHYQGDRMNALDVIDAFKLNFCLGNAVKYVLRCEHKDNKVQDPEKAIWYLKHEIDKHGRDS